MLQLHTRRVMKPKHKRKLSRKELREVLEYLMFLKRKRTGVVKGRGCADGRKQRAYISREDAASPTVMTELVFITAVIDALERRDVGTADLPGAFMQADMDELVHVRLVGKMVEMLLEIDRELYGPYVVYEKGEPVIYVELLKALYGTVRAAWLFYETLTTKLEGWGFEMNPYDPCVANKMINGKQCTVIWHVDDLKISHIDPDVVTDMMEKLNAEFGKEAPITQNRGKKHDYLGMTLNYEKEGEVNISMKDYIKGVIAEAPEDMKGTAATPAGHHLFTVSENPTPLDKDTAEVFHHITMQLQYLSQRARPDIRTALSFLCTRVKQPDTDDYKKLVRVMKYLQATIDMPLRLKADGSGIVKWWVDASYAVHSDMKSHTGGTMSMGAGSVYSTATKQKLMTRSSTEGELVGVHDVMPQIVWTRYFLEHQGFKVNDSMLYQDNKSAILLEKNGRASSGKRTRHINIRYFFVKDRVDSKEIKIEHCPTEDMIADYFTKPLQGALFIKLRNLIMNVDPNPQEATDQRSVLSNEDKDKVKENASAGQNDVGRKTYLEVLMNGENKRSEK